MLHHFVERRLDTVSYTHLDVYKRQGLKRGVLLIDRFRIFIIPWSSGFSAASFGTNTAENIKLSLSLNKLIQLELGLSFPTKSTDNAKNDKKKTSKKVHKARSKKSKPRANKLTI